MLLVQFLCLSLNLVTLVMKCNVRSFGLSSLYVLVESTKSIYPPILTWYDSYIVLVCNAVHVCKSASVWITFNCFCICLSFVCCLQPPTKNPFFMGYEHHEEPSSWLIWFFVGMFHEEPSSSWAWILRGPSNILSDVTGLGSIYSSICVQNSSRELW
ncbi:hypothetical protein HanIR_Chr06g0279201 [Helianthus annuus]|nr:hypothetical protein HanIR_Chr06g0279201 [Helianthus annuus]